MMFNLFFATMVRISAVDLEVKYNIFLDTQVITLLRQIEFLRSK